MEYGRKSAQLTIFQMKVYSNVYVVILAFVAITFLIWISIGQKDSSVVEENEPLSYHDASVFFEEKNFFDQILNSNNKQKLTRDVSGVVIPHHLLASDIIVEFFSNIPNSQSVKRVILIGPNHYERGDTVFTTSRYGWKTPVGDVLPDINLIDELTKKTSSLEVNELVIEQEHSIGGIASFIAHYLPTAHIVPIVISRQANLSDLKELATILKNIDTEETIFVSSVDFSHYLSLSEAEEKDSETLKILRQRDLETLLKLDESNTDSPEALALLLLLMEQQGIYSFDVVEHKNSADYTNKTEVETTSYYSIIFTK